jgi:hypothetical protein
LDSNLFKSLKLPENKVVLVLPTSALQSVLDYARDNSPTRIYDGTSQQNAANYLKQTVLEDLCKSHRFKPCIVDIEWVPDTEGLQCSEWCKKLGYVEWGRHPNGLYAIYMHGTFLKAVREHTTIGLWSPDRNFLTLNQAKEIDDPLSTKLEDKYKKATDPKAIVTVTVVTKRNIINTRKYDRNPDQITTMGGVSPNEVSTSRP